MCKQLKTNKKVEANRRSRRKRRENGHKTFASDWSVSLRAFYKPIKMRNKATVTLLWISLALN